jgi:Tfp pilus assembly protein PilV
MNRNLPNGQKRPMGHLRRRQRGISLIEALIAFVVMGVGMLSIIGVQAALRFNGDIAKQRSEAVRLAQEEIERLRAFSVLDTTPGSTAFEDIVAQGATEVTGYTSNASYNITREVEDIIAQGYKSVRVEVSWEDRFGEPQAVALSTLITGADPMVSGMVALPANPQTTKNPLGRSLKIPGFARNLDGSRSVIKVDPEGIVAWVFDNHDGVVRLCTVPAEKNVLELSNSDIGDCGVNGYLLTGYVRFSDVAVLTAEEALNPLGTPLELDMLLGGEGLCVDDSELALDTELAFITYACLVYPEASGTWDGSLQVVMTEAEPPVTVCTYNATYEGTGPVARAAYPASFEGVENSLQNRNFLVLPGAATCP